MNTRAKLTLLTLFLFSLACFGQARPIELSYDRTDDNDYIFYATNKSNLNQTIDLFEGGTTKDGVYAFAQNLDGNSSAATWDANDPQPLSEVAMGRYYVYLDPLGADAGDYIIISDHTVNIIVAPQIDEDIILEKSLDLGAEDFP